MSLHALAGHMATKGRGGDSMLVHMTPEEVQSLQAMALKGGGSLTINPDTGLPEANFLKKMLPMIAGFALGPAGFGLMSAGMAGAAVGGITALSTGSLSRGLMAGLGAYGGASLGAGLAGAGAGAAQEAAMVGVGEGASQAALNEAAAKATTDFMSKGMVDRLTEGATAAFNDPKAFVQGMGGMGKLAQTGLAAISPIMADEGVQTTTKRPDTGTIRNFTFDPYGQTYSSAGNYPASEYKGMAQGGIVALAAGGTSDQPLYLGLDKSSSAADVAAAYSQFAGGAGGDTAANQREAVAFLQSRGIGDDIITQGYQQFLSPAQQAQAQAQVQEVTSAPVTTNAAGAAAGPAAGSAAYNTMVGNWFSQYPNATAADISNAISTYGLNPQDVANAMRASGLSNAAQYAAFQPDVGVPDTPLGGLAGLSSNINDWLSKYPTAKRAEAEQAMATWGLNENDILRATGRTLDELFKEQKKPIITGNIDTVGNLPGGVSGGGNTIVNPNGSITTYPNIPGRPEGGFTGMGQVKDVYTQGGGSLGYVNKAPTTMEEFDQRFNKQTGDSLAAYEYLMGKGANNNAYPTKSGVEQIMRPYSEVTTGIPAAEGRPTQKYIFQNGKYVENPNYRPMSYNSKGERIVGLTPTEVIKGLAPFKGANDDAGLFDFVSQNNISEAQLAAALGISIAEARARLAAAKKTSTAATNANVQTDNSGYGDGNTTAPPPGVEGVATDSPDGVTNAASGGRVRRMALGGLGALAGGGAASQYNLGSYSDGGRLLRGPGDGVSDSIPATIGGKQPARLADGEFVVPARIVSELGNGSTEAGARKLYAMMDRVQKARGKTTGKNRVAANTRSDKYLPA